MNFDSMKLSSVTHRLKYYYDRLLAPETDWIQIEVSSHCNASCSYCPRTVYREAWKSRHLPLAIFRNLLPAMANTGLVFLQGWGEPFLNPDIFTMITMARKTGSRVGTTTNGMLLNKSRIERLIDCGIDLISFSMAGLDEKNDAFRKGTNLQKVLDTIRAFQLEKEKRNLSRPSLHVSYLLLRSGLGDIAKLPDVLCGLGIDQVVISTLDFIPVAELEEEALCPGSMVEYNRLRSVLDNVKNAAGVKGLPVYYNLAMKNGPRKICSENPQRSFYVASDGSVSPCVFTNPPVSNVPRRFHGENLPWERLVFGNVEHDSVSYIWQKKEYIAFRKSFDTERLNHICRNCYKLYVG